MRNFFLTANIVLPVFLVMAAGWFCRRIGMMNDKTTSQLNNLVFRVFLPMSLCKSLMSVEPGAMASPKALLVAFCGIVGGFFLGLALVPRMESENPRRGVVIQSFFRSNYAIFGIPVCEALFPNGDGGVAAMMVIATVPVFNALAVVALELYRGGKMSPKKTLIGIAKNPLILGCAAGILLMLLPFDLPEFAVSTIGKLAAASSPLALFVLGASINLQSIKGNLRSLAFASGVRLVAVPLVMLPIAYALGLRGAEFATLMIVFGSPCAVSSYTMAAQMDGDEELAAQAVMLTTVLSSVTIFAMIFMFKQFGIF